MQTLQIRLLGGHVLALLAVLTGDILASTVLMTVGFAGVFLTLAALAVVAAAALVDGVAHRPMSMLAEPRQYQ
jgi:hypothetical protein